VEVRGRGLQDLLNPVRELGVVAHQDRARLQVFHVVERLVAHRAFYLVPVRNLAHHLPEGMGLALAGISGHRDVQPVRVLHGLRCHREDHAPGKDLVTDMLLGKCREHQGCRIAVFQHIECCRPDIGVCRHRGRALIPFVLSFGLRPVLPPAFLFLLPVLPLRGPVRFELLAQFLPPLSTTAAGCVFAADKDRAVRKLDRKGPVFVGR